MCRRRWGIEGAVTFRVVRSLLAEDRRLGIKADNRRRRGRRLQVQRRRVGLLVPDVTGGSWNVDIVQLGAGW